MKTGNKVLSALVIGTLLLVFAFAAFMAFFSDRAQEKKKVSVILNDSMSDSWITVKQGMEQAAVDYGIELNIVLTDRMTGAGDELVIIKREIENGTDGIVVEPVEQDQFAEFLDQNSGNAAVVMIGSDINPTGLYSCICPDDEEVGRSVARAVIADAKAAGITPVVGIMTDSQKQLSMIKRLSGLKSEISKYVQTAWVEDIDDFSYEEFVSSTEKKGVTAVIALGTYETQKCVEYLERMGRIDDIDIYGVGYSENSVYYLDKGLIRNLVLTDGFKMGYQSIASINARMKPFSENTDTTTQIFSVDSENLYDEDMQKILFPLVQ